MRFYLTLLLTAMMVCNLFATPQNIVFPTATAIAKSSLLSPRKQNLEKRVANIATSSARQMALSTSSIAKKSPAMQLTTPSSIAKATKEEITLNFDKFAYFDYYPSSGDWFLSMSCDDPTKPEYGYVVKFDYFAPADNPWGTFTTEDFDMTYSLIGINKEIMVFYEKVTLTVSQIRNGNKSSIIAEATILGDDGNTYHVKCVEETITPAEQYQCVINNASMTKGDSRFTVRGSNQDMNATLIVNSSSILGTYDQSMINLTASKFLHRGKLLQPMQISADVTSNTVNGKLSYVTTISLLTTDTVQYDITMNAPLPDPTQTVDIVCQNLLVDESYVDWYGKIFADAYTSTWFVDLSFDAYYLVEGPYSNDVTCSITNRITNEEVTALQLYLNLALDSNGRWIIKGTVRGSDNVIYNLDLSWTVPDATKVVKVSFNECADAAYWVQDNDLQLSNLTDDYYVSLDVINVAVGQQFGWEQMDHDFSGIIDFNLSYYIEVADATNGLIEQIGDTTKISVSLIAFNEVQYDVTLWYTAPEPTKTVEATIPVDFNNLLEDGAFQLHNSTSGSNMIVSFTVLTHELEGAYVNDGMFGRLGAENGQYDFMDDYTYIAVWNGEEYDMLSVSKGQMTVSMDEKGNITAFVDVVCNNAVKYLLTITSHYNSSLPDWNTQPVDHIYTAQDKIELKDYTASNGKISCTIYAADFSDLTYLLFFTDQSDPDIVIPVGTYPIDTTGLPGTVQASPGVQNNEVYPSVYAKIDDEGYVQLPLWVLTGGTITVSKTTTNQLYFEINATNNQETPIHIVYNGGGEILANVKNIIENPSISKLLRNGQLLIQKDGRYYNLLGNMID